MLHCPYGTNARLKVIFKHISTSWYRSKVSGQCEYIKRRSRHVLVIRSEESTRYISNRSTNASNEIIYLSKLQKHHNKFLVILMCSLTTTASGTHDTMHRYHTQAMEFTLSHHVTGNKAVDHRNLFHIHIYPCANVVYVFRIHNTFELFLKCFIYKK